MTKYLTVRNGQKLMVWMPPPEGILYGWLPRGKNISVEVGMISVAAMYTVD
jgi:hypothetical protein